MTAIINATVSSLISAVLQEYVAWQAVKARDATWKPSPADIEEFIQQIDAESPDAVRARVAQAMGIPWPPKPAVTPAAPAGGS